MRFPKGRRRSRPALRRPRTDAPKAFRYLAMAARKSLNVYAIPEAERGFRKALAFLRDTIPAVAAPREAAPVVVGLLETMMLKSDYREAGRIADAYMPVVKRAGETPELVIAYYYQTLALVQRYELRAGLERMTEAGAVAEKIGDPRALAFAQAGLLHCRTRLGLDTREEAERRTERGAGELPQPQRQLPAQFGLFLRRLGLPLSRAPQGRAGAGHSADRLR